MLSWLRMFKLLHDVTLAADYSNVERSGRTVGGSVTSTQGGRRSGKWLCIFCWALVQLETHLASRWRPEERRWELMKDRGTMPYWSYWFNPLPLKNGHPSPNILPLTPPQTGKPLLNNIIACLILTVTSARSRRSLIESLERAGSPLMAGCVRAFDCFLFTRRCVCSFFFLTKKKPCLVWTTAELLFIKLQ